MTPQPPATVAGTKERFPDSELCNECGLRWPIGALTGDGENGGWWCPDCMQDTSSLTSAQAQD